MNNKAIWIVDPNNIQSSKEALGKQTETKAPGISSQVVLKHRGPFLSEEKGNE
jgi:hypothetical protein